MYALVSEQKAQLRAGAVVRMPGTWEDYCAWRDSRGDRSQPRVRFREGDILLMNPMPRHGREAHLLARTVELLLDTHEQNYEAFTPITMEIPDHVGIEPDYCFYIEHWQAVVGKDRMDWQTDPPPDLAIEVDVTSFTAVNDYARFRVPEVWILRSTGLEIFVLQGDTYELKSKSGLFPQRDVADLVSTTVTLAAEQGSGTALRRLREQLAE